MLEGCNGFLEVLSVSYVNDVEERVYWELPVWIGAPGVLVCADGLTNTGLRERRRERYLYLVNEARYRWLSQIIQIQ